MKTRKIKIKDIAVIDRPRERLLSQGVAALSNTELIGLLLRSGTEAMPIMSLAGKLVSVAKNDMSQLQHMDIATLCRIKGIGKVRAGTLKAALELERRLKYSELG